MNAPAVSAPMPGDVEVVDASSTWDSNNPLSPFAVTIAASTSMPPAPPHAPSSSRAEVSPVSGSYTNARPDLTEGSATQNSNNNNNNNKTNTNATSIMQNSTAQPAGSLFGNAGNNNINNNNTNANSLFGASGGLGLMSSSSNTNMFSNSMSNNTTTNNNNNHASSVFTPTQRQGPAPSLLGAAQHKQMAQSTPFGRLSMGQNAASTNTTVGAAKVDLDNLRPTTRFEDCIDQVKQEMGAIDKMIQEQEKYAKEIEAFLPKHGENVDSLLPDVTFIADKADDVEQALANDAQGVEAQRKNVEKDRKDVERCQRIVTNLALPQGYQYTGMNSAYGSMYGQQRPQQPPSTGNREDTSNYDTDLIGNYFVPMAAELQKTMDAYASNLTEIESHMRVIETSAVAQAQQLAQRKAGVGGQNSGDATIRELADTLRGFEESILGVAGVVGECRDGVNELVLGQIGG